MASLPSNPTAPIVGKAISAGAFGIPVADWVNFFRQSPALSLRQHTTPTTLTTSVWTALPFDDELVDTVNGHSLVTNTTRYTAVYPGTYRFYGRVGIEPNTSGLRAVAVAKNGAAPVQSILFAQSANSNGNGYVQVEDWYPLNVGDYVELKAWQDSGGSLSTVLDATQLVGQWVSA